MAKSTSHNPRFSGAPLQKKKRWPQAIFPKRD